MYRLNRIKLRRPYYDILFNLKPSVNQNKDLTHFNRQKQFHIQSFNQQEVETNNHSKLTAPLNDKLDFYNTSIQADSNKNNPFEFKKLSSTQTQSNRNIINSNEKFNRSRSLSPNDITNNKQQTITTQQIIHFLGGLGQVAEQDTNQYFLVKCPDCHNDSNLSASKTFLKPGHGSYYCSNCTTRGTWEEFKEKSLKLQKEIKKDSYLPNNLGQLCVSELLGRTYYKVEENKFIANVLCGKNSPLSKDTLNSYWVSMGFFKPTSGFDPNSKLLEEELPCAIFPRTSPIDFNNLSNKEFKITSFKATTFPASKFNCFEPKSKPEPGLFGYHLINPECDTIALTPTEADAMSIYQATGIPALSLPKNIYQLPIENMPLLARFKKIYLWFDGDVQGQNAAQLFARKLGFHRCYLVKNILPNEDKVISAYDCLAKGYDLNLMLNQASLISHSKVVDFHKLKDSVLLEILYADQVKGIPSKDFPTLNQIIKGFRPGELTIFTGPTGTGKTTFLSQLSLDYCRSGVATLWGSFEIQNTRLAKKMLFQFAGKDIGPDTLEFNHWSEQFQQLPLYFLKFFGTTQVQEVLEAMEHAIHAHDVQHVVIDNLQFMTSGLARGPEKFELQDDAVAAFRRFATQFNVHVTLVAHPKKDDREFLEIGSVFGSAKITQEADNVIILQGGQQGIRFIDVKKNRFDGTVGMVPVQFDSKSYRSKELNEEEIIELNKKLKEIKMREFKR